MNELLPQTLYLKGSSGTKIVKDGPALRIKTRKNSDQLIPFRRIERIHSFGNVQWQMEALLGCADNQIQILFCRQNGELRASLHTETGLDYIINMPEHLGKCLDSTEGAAILKRWLILQQQQSRYKCIHQVRQNFSQALYKSFEQLVHHLVMPYLKQPEWKKCQQLMMAHIRCDICHKLSQQGIQTDMPFLKLHHIQLLNEISISVEAELLPSLLQQVRKLKKIRERKMSKNIDIFRQVVGWHQQLCHEITEQCDNYILHLHRLLLETYNANEYR